MAVDDDFNDGADGSGGAQQSSPGLGKLLLVSLLVSLISAGGVGAGVYFLLKADIAAQQQAEGEEAGEVEEEEEEPKEPPIYYSLEDPFIVNLSNDTRRFLQLTVELMARDQAVIDAVKEHRPRLRNNLLLLFSAETPESISAAEGKEALRLAALAEVQSVLEDLGEPTEVEELYFTSLVMQ
ncbi:MAG: flagellar basal body-associated FliL family protein [Pseudohaliea sp.]